MSAAASPASPMSYTSSSSSSSSPCSAVTKSRISYLAPVPINYSADLEQRIGSVFANFVQLMEASTRQGVTRYFTIVLGINAEKSVYVKKETEIKAICEKLKDEYFYSRQIDLVLTSHDWQSGSGAVNYAQIRNDIWFSREMRVSVDILVNACKKSDYIDSVKIIALDPDTEVDPAWLIKAEQSGTAVTAGYYSYLPRDPDPFVDASGALNWKDPIADVANRMDIRGKKIIGRSTFYMTYRSPLNSLESLGYNNKKNSRLFFCKVNFSEFIKNIEFQTFLLGKFSNDPSLARLLGVYEALNDLLDPYKKQGAFPDRLRPALDRLIEQLKVAESDSSIQKSLALVSLPIRGKQLLYPNEALMVFSVYDKNSKADYSGPLLDKKGKQGTLWGENGKGEGQSVITHLQDDISTAELIDYIEDPTYTSEIPDRVYEPSVKFRKNERIPRDLKTLRTIDELHFRDKLIKVLVHEAFEKKQSCLQHYYLEQRNWFIDQLKIDRLEIDTENRKSLKNQLESVVADIRGASTAAATEMFKRVINEAIAVRPAAAPLTLATASSASSSQVTPASSDSPTSSPKTDTPMAQTSPSSSLSTPASRTTPSPTLSLVTSVNTARSETLDSWGSPAPASSPSLKSSMPALTRAISGPAPDSWEERA